MADYLKKFATQADYDAYIEAGYPKPNVSYIVDTDEIIFTNYQDGPAGPDSVLESVKIADFTGTTFNGARFYITEAYIPDGVTTIGDNAFNSFTFLTSVRIPDTVTTIRMKAFYNCESLTSVNIPDSVTSIGEQAFFSCALTSMTIPDTVTTIDQYVFYGCKKLTSVTVRATTPPTLGSNAFSNTHANLVIYVPAESVEAYKAAANWSTYASRIQAISE